MSDLIAWYQSFPELKIEGRMDTPKEFRAIHLPRNLDGKTVLDIGCNSGAFLNECLKRDAECVMGVEKNLEWRIIANGLLKELRWPDIQWEIIDDVRWLKGEKYDLVLLLSVLHLVDEPQKLLHQAIEMNRGLLIVEINDRLQTKKVRLPKNAKFMGKNKDNRSVWHIKAQHGRKNKESKDNS